MKKRIEIEVEFSGKFEETGEYRTPLADEWFLGARGPEQELAESPTGCPHVMLRKRPWRARHGGSYFFVDDEGTVDDTMEVGDAVDRRRWEIGNYFEDRARAESAAERVLAAFKEGRS